jgi:hypothetical protein
MRNLLEYPIRYEEIIEVLDRACESNKPFIGGIDSYVLFMLQHFVVGNEQRVLDYFNEAGADIQSRVKKD